MDFGLGLGLGVGLGLVNCQRAGDIMTVIMTADISGYLRPSDLHLPLLLKVREIPFCPDTCHQVSHELSYAMSRLAFDRDKPRNLDFVVLILWNGELGMTQGYQLDHSLSLRLCSDS